MLKTKLIVAIASLSFAVSCTKSSDTAPAPEASGPTEIEINVSRLSMNGTQDTLAVDFGSVAKSKSSARTIKLVNDEQLPITITLDLQDGDASAKFKLTANSCPASLAKGKSCSITIQGTGLINGTELGVASLGSLDITAGATYHADLQIKVTGDSDVLAATDADLQFTTAIMSTAVYQAGKSQIKTVSVKNNSAKGIHPGNISIAADGWAMTSSTCAAPLGPQKTCVITLSFKSWQLETASSLSYQASVSGAAIPAATNPSASSTTCKPSSARILKDWKATETKSEIITTADVGNATALTREAVQPYQVGAAKVLEVCGNDGISLSKALDTCPANFHKVEPKSMPGAQISDFYCEPDTVTCI